MERKTINISRFVAVPVYVGVQDNYIWTGMIRSDKINQQIIRDKQKREEFKKLVEEYERNILMYRKISREAFGKKSNSQARTSRMGDFFRSDEPEAIRVRIEDLSRKIKEFLQNYQANEIDTDLLFIELAKDYEDILEKNPHEFDYISTDILTQIKTFKKDIDKRDICIREMYDQDKKRYICKPFFTREQERRFSFGEKSKDKLLQAIRAIAGKEDVSSKEALEILQELSANIAITDLREMYPERTFAGMQYISVFKNYLLKKGYTFEQIQQMSLNEIKDMALESYNSEGIDMHSGLVADCVMDNIQYLDMDKFLLATLLRSLESYERMGIKKDDDDIALEGESDIEEKVQFQGKGPNEDAYIVQEIRFDGIIKRMKRTEEIIRRVLEARIIDRRAKIDIFLDDESAATTANCSRIERLLKNFCDGIYITDVTNTNLIYNAFEDADEMEKWSDELVKRLTYTKSQLSVLSLVNFENLRRLYSLGKMSREDVDELILQTKSDDFEEGIKSIFEKAGKEKIDLILQNASMLMSNLYKSKIIDENDLRDYFDDNIITVDEMVKISEGLSEEERAEFYESIKSAFGQEHILEKYKAYVDKEKEYLIIKELCPDHTDKLAELEEELDEAKFEKDKYALVFRRFCGNMSKEEKVAMLEHYYFEMGMDDEELLQRSITEMYDDKIIGLEDIIAFDSGYIVPMLDKLSLEDATKIRNSMSIEELEKMLDPIFLDSDYKYFNISDERKFIIIMNLLGEDTEKDKELREQYLELLDFNYNERYKRARGKKDIRPVIDDNADDNARNDYNQYAYPDVIKWRFFKALDKDMKVTRYSNGYVEFASSKLGTRIIEKYYEKDREVYGYATYMLSEDNYQKNRSRLITRKASSDTAILEPVKMKEITPRKDRISHRTHSKDKTWMDEILKYFDIDLTKEFDTRYSKEDFEFLKREIPVLKEKYKMIER